MMPSGSQSLARRPSGALLDPKSYNGVADRGMISAPRSPNWSRAGSSILRTRERTDAEIRGTVPADTTGMVPIRKADKFQKRVMN